MPNNWKTYKLGDLIQHQKGFAFKSEWYQEKGSYVVRVSDTTDNSIDISTCNKIDNHLASRYQNFNLKHNDIVIATVGSWPPNYSSVVGKVIKVPKQANGALLNQNAVRLRTADGELFDQSFIYYLMKSNNFLNYIVNSAQGSANQASIKLTDIFNYEFLLPCIAIQRNIASILSAIDDKIELNLQMNKTLEEMAMTLYKHWFVDFGPFQNGEFVDSELGMIPKDWEVKRVDAITNFIDPHPSHRAPEIEENGYPFAGIGDIDEMGNINVSKARQIGIDAVEKQEKSYLINDKSIGFGRVGTVGKVVRLRPQSFRYSISPTMAVINAISEEYSELSYYMVKSDGFLTQVYNNQTGSTRPTIGIQTLRELKVVLPKDINQIKSFRELVRNFYEMGDSLNCETQILTTLRDTLLPKLISGEVRVKEAETILERVFPIKTGTK